MLIESPPVRSAIQTEEGAIARPWPAWFKQVYALLFGLTRSGLTAERPTKDLWVGRPYWDSDLGIPIWWDGADWVDATGASV